jgi:hypothetical protein
MGKRGGGMDWTDVALVNAVMNLRIPYSTGNCEIRYTVKLASQEGLRKLVTSTFLRTDRAKPRQTQ